MPTRRRSSKARSRTRPSSVCSSEARRRRRRHGPSLRSSTGNVRAEQVIEEFKKGDAGQGASARRRRREGAHLARHPATRRRSVRGGRRAQGRRRHLPGERIKKPGARRRRSSAPTSRPSSGAPRSPRPLEQRPERCRSAGRITASRFDRRTTGPGLDQALEDGRGEGGDRPVRLLRFGRDARRYSRYRAQARHRKEGLTGALHGQFADAASACTTKRPRNARSGPLG